jgi:hypothetical protein
LTGSATPYIHFGNESLQEDHMWQDRGPGRALLEGSRSAFVVAGALVLCSAAAPAHAGGQEMSTAATPSGPALGAACALPYLHGSRGSDCGGWHRIVYSTSGASPDAIVRAELLAMALDGTVIQAIPVKIGDQAHLASRIGQRDLKVMSKGDKHQVFAPLPMLRITVEDDGKKAQAFCSNIPYLQLVESKGAVVTESDGNTTNLLAAIPRVQADSLALRVDGVNVFEALGVSPSSCTPGSPCGGTVNVGGTPVHVSNLIVDSGAIEVESSNSVRMTLAGLGCGGHIHRLDGDMQPGALRNTTSASCNVDDLADQGTSSVFGITIETPTEQSANNPVPTPVVGEVCAGRDIVSVTLNGAPATSWARSSRPVTG